ncbi:hypothetical protein GGS20DRAFT_144237 [Poronia punctata]|nr:hypothetical protein GGS20DRAFT_144237 [Poronia punctata]
MGKGAITKKKKAPSLHSRSARRATSPSIDTDKSLKIVRPPPESVDNRPSVLSIHHGAGVTKKQKRGKALSSKARKRQEKAQDRAAAVMERTEKKIAISKGQSRTIQSRRKVWDEVNQQIPLVQLGAQGKINLEEEESSEESEFDREMGDVEESAGQPSNPTKKHMDPVPETGMVQDDDDGIL